MGRWAFQSLLSEGGQPHIFRKWRCAPPSLSLPVHRVERGVGIPIYFKVEVAMPISFKVEMAIPISFEVEVAILIS